MPKLCRFITFFKLIWVTHGTSIYDFAAGQLGLQTHASYVPHPLSANGDHMDFFGRILNLFWHASGVEFVNLPRNLLDDEARMFRERKCFLIYA